MKARILLIQFRRNENSVVQEQACVARELGEDVEMTALSALDETQAWEKPKDILEHYDGVVLGGSGDFDFDGNRGDHDQAKAMSYVFLRRLEPLLQHIFANDIPTLGICYGHQLLGAYKGATVQYDESQKKSRSHEVHLRVSPESEPVMFTGLPESFMAHYGHKDALDRLPDGAVLLMDGEAGCRYAMLKYQDNIYTTQFHPELRFGDMVERIKSSPGYLPENVSVEDLFTKDDTSSKVLQNFARFVGSKVGQG